jgi:hypothetical protein
MGRRSQGIYCPVAGVYGSSCMQASACVGGEGGTTRFLSHLPWRPRLAYENCFRSGTGRLLPLARRSLLALQLLHAIVPSFPGCLLKAVPQSLRVQLTALDILYAPLQR